MIDFLTPEQRAELAILQKQPRTYSAIQTSSGITVCDSYEGAALKIRFPEEIERLKALLDTLVITKQPSES